MTLHPTPIEQELLAAARADNQAEVERLTAIIDAEQAAQERRLRTPGALRDAALWYATTLNWPVFPCAPGEKRPATRHGLKDATTDIEQINKWWKVNPMYNIGLPTGIAFDVFDIDGPEGLLAFGEFIDAQVVYPHLIGLSLTPRGRHYLMPPRGTRNTTNPIGVDCRGEGGYIVAPPSLTLDGTYRWTIPPQPERNAA